MKRAVQMKARAAGPRVKPRAAQRRHISMGLPASWDYVCLVLGLSGHWSEVAATTAMVWSAVAEVVSILRAHFQRWPGAAGGPSPPRRIAPAQWPNGPMADARVKQSIRATMSGRSSTNAIAWGWQVGNAEAAAPLGQPLRATLHGARH